MVTIRTLIRKILGQGTRYNENDWPSVVILLRKAEFPEICGTETERMNGTFQPNLNRATILS